MTESEQKIYDKLLVIHGEMRVYSTIQTQHKDDIMELAVLQGKTTKALQNILDDKNKFKGAMWLFAFIGGFGGVMGIITFFWSIFTK